MVAARPTELLPNGRLAAPTADSAPPWSPPPDQAIATGPESSARTSADSQRLWYQIALARGASAWVQAAVPSPSDTGSDGRPSSLRFDAFPAIATD